MTKEAEQTIEVGGVVIIATRPIVQKDLTSTTSTVSSDQISKLPVETAVLEIASTLNSSGSDHAVTS